MITYKMFFAILKCEILLNVKTELFYKIPLIRHAEFISASHSRSPMRS